MSDGYQYRDSSLLAHRRREPSVTFCLAEPFDTICRRLTAEYLEAGWRHLARTLADFRLDPGVCEWGAGHPGLMATPRRAWEEHPLNGVGWWMPEEAAVALYSELDGDGWWLAVWAEIDECLRASDPPLMVAIHGHRSEVVRDSTGGTLAVDDGEIGLAVLIADALDESSAWMGRLDAGSGPWADLAAALWHRDERSFDTALGRALHEYTAAGAELVVRGFAAFAVRWLNDDMPRGGGGVPPC